MQRKMKNRLSAVEALLQDKQHKLQPCGVAAIDEFVGQLQEFLTEVMPRINGGPSLSESLKIIHLQSSAEQLIPGFVDRDPKAIREFEALKRDWIQLFGSLAFDRAMRVDAPACGPSKRDENEFSITEFRMYEWQDGDSDLGIGVLCRIRSDDTVEAEACSLKPPFESVEVHENSESAALQAALYKLTGKSSAILDGQLDLVGSKLADKS